MLVQLFFVFRSKNWRCMNDFAIIFTISIMADSDIGNDTFTKSWFCSNHLIHGTCSKDEAVIVHSLNRYPIQIMTKRHIHGSIHYVVKKVEYAPNC